MIDISPDDDILQFKQNHVHHVGSHETIINAWLRKRVPTFEDNYTGPEFPPDGWERLLKSMGHTNCVGLSANQIGIGARAFIIRVNREVRVLDPIVLEISDEDEALMEGCMSVGDGKFLASKETHRPYQIKVEYTHDGHRHQEILYGMEARVFLHEYDHLNGFIFTDHEVIGKHLRNQLILTAGLFEPSFINWVPSDKGRASVIGETPTTDHYEDHASYMARRLSGSFEQRLKYMIDSNYYEEIEAW